MATEKFANNAETTINQGGGVDNSTDPVVFTVTDGSVFPSTGNFRIRIDNEILLVTSRSTNSITASRAQENTTIAAHSNGSKVTHVLTAGSLDQRLIDQVFSSAYASKLTSEKQGRLFLPSDGYTLERDDGSNWKPWGPIFPFTPPVDGSYSWVNQGSASVITTKGSIFLSAPVASGENIRIRDKSIPSAPYTITAAFIPCLSVGPYPMCGIGLRNSTSGKIVFFQMYCNNAHLFLGIRRYDSPTAFNSDTYIVTASWISGLVFLRIVDDNTNRKFYYSKDGQNFVLFYSESRTLYITPDKLFFGVNSLGTIGDIVGMNLLSWKEE